MQNTDGLTPIDRELEAALGGLRVAPATISRNRVMFDAGRASARRRSRLWQGSSCVLTVLLLASVVSRPTPTAPQRPAETVAERKADISPAALSAASTPAIDAEQVRAFRRYLRMRQAVLERGIDALPGSTEIPGSIDPPLTRENLDELLSST
ncbi:MAG: hypothetical protein RBR19_18795 [Sedimentisphaerales bacterium]|jgi:hypothetical protein|nr:hypothetical protein [Sedimentisphaerales bacterium]